MSTQDQIDYVELPSRDLDKTRAFFSEVFSWEFKDYGMDYTFFRDQGISGGFYRSVKKATNASGSALIVMYSNDLNDTQKKIIAAGGKIIKPIFTFPGGARFHFADPTGNEFGVWSDKYEN